MLRWHPIQHSLPNVNLHNLQVYEDTNAKHSCWDGKNLDTPDHKSHVAYPTNGAHAFDGSSTGGTCPDTHPVKIPQIMLEVRTRAFKS
jgi:hypothetical protein